MKKKNILAILLVALIVFVNSEHVLASGDNSAITDRKEIERIYYSDPELMEEVELEDIISISSKIQNFYEPSTPGLVKPMGHISPSKMRLNITTARLNNSKQHFLAIVTAKWLSPPTIHHNDVIALSWGNGYTSSNDVLELTYESGDVELTRGQMIQGTPNASIGRRFRMVRFVGNYPKVDRVKSVKYVVTLDNHGDKKSTNINAGYAHKYFGIGDIGLSYEDGKVGFSANITVKYDEMFNQISYYPPK